MKKLCFINVTSKAGGGPAQMVQLIKGLDPARWQVTVCTQNDGPFWGECAKLGAQMVDLNFRQISIISFVRLFLFLLNQKPNLVHTHGKGAGVYGRAVCALLRIPVVHTFHGIHIDRYKELSRKIYFLFEWGLSLLTRVHICVGQAEKDRIIQLCMASENKIKVIPNAVAVDTCKKFGWDSGRGEKLKQLGLNFQRGTFLCGTVSRISPAKGLTFQLKAFAQFFQQIPDFPCHLIVVGGCPEGDEGYHQSLLEIMNRLGLEQKVTWTGYRSDAIEIMRCLDLYLSASLWEGLPLSILESAMIGIPMMLTDIGPHREIIESEENAILIQPSSSESFFRGLQMATSMSQEQRDQMARGSQKRVADHFSIEKMKADTYRIYEEISN